MSNKKYVNSLFLFHHLMLGITEIFLSASIVPKFFFFLYYYYFRFCYVIVLRYDYNRHQWLVLGKCMCNSWIHCCFRVMRFHTGTNKDNEWLVNNNRFHFFSHLIQDLIRFFHSVFIICLPACQLAFPLLCNAWWHQIQ